MKEQNHLPSFISEEETALLRVELLQQAANGYEQVGFWREAAECWTEQGEPSRAGALYAQGGDVGRAARAWLEAGRYHDALSAYQQWEHQIQGTSRPNLLDWLEALLGQSACHLLGTRSSPSEVSPELSQAKGRQVYRQARELLAQAIASTSMSVTASYWEALGDYGGWLGRYSLVQEGYERALAALESRGERTLQVRICRAYLAQARTHDDRLLCQQLEERLAVWPEEVSGFGNSSPGTRVSTYRGHATFVRSVSWSPNSSHLASAADEEVHLWDAIGDHTLLTFHADKLPSGPVSYIHTVAWSPNGSSLATAGPGMRTQIWDATSGDNLLTCPREITERVAWSPDGTRIAASRVENSSYAVEIWDIAKSCKIIEYSGHSESISAIAWSPDGTRIASSEFFDAIHIWNANSGESLRVYRLRDLGAILILIESVAWSPDSSSIAFHLQGSPLYAWNAISGKLTLTCEGNLSAVTSIAWSLDGTRIAAAVHETVHVWDATTGKMLVTYQGHVERVDSITWSPEGSFIASASDDYTVQIWTTV